MKVRIPFVLSSKGNWYASGGNEEGPDWGLMMDCADRDATDDNFIKGFVEVDLPAYPEPVVLQGSAAAAGET